MRVEITLGTEVSDWNQVFLDRKEIQKLFRFLSRELRGSSVMTSALKLLNVKRVSCVALHFCGDVEMRSLQKHYRKIDRTTDVLSFPALEISGVAALYPSLPVQERSWGALVVSLNAVERGARRGRRSPPSELREVLIHGFLHLLGMDHVLGKGVTARHAREMRDLQRLLLKKFMKATMASL
jgi:probable rRNA maturation factor